MANSVEIPQDIIDNVIAALGNDKHWHALKQCTLVSSSFLLPSRKQLFYSISFGSSNEGCQRLHQVLVQNPVFRSFVRRINVDVHRQWHWGSSRRTEPASDKVLLAILQLPFCHLEEFLLSSFDAAKSWSGELKDALSTLIHSPTLKILYLYDIDNVPITIFLGIVHLTELHLSDFSLNCSDGEQPSSLTPKGVATTASHPVIDRCVWSFGRPKRDYPTEARFLPFMSHLRVLEININPSSATMSDFAILSFLMRCLCASLSSPATLEHIKLKITFEGNDNCFDFYAFYGDLGGDAVWRHLDSLVTHPAGSQLQRVDIDIDYSFREDNDVREPDNDEILEVVLDSLPLLSDKGILFVEAKETCFWLTNG